MGRKSKYEFGTKVLSVSINTQLYDLIMRKAKKEGVTPSDFANAMFSKLINDDITYHAIKAKEYCRLMHMHLAEIKYIEDGKNIPLPE